MAKKRQVMRMTFGDYRTKMQREEKKNAAAMKKTFLTAATSEKHNKSTFYRRSTSAAVSPRLSSGSGPPGGSELCTVPEADSSEESITSLEKQAHGMTLSEEGQNQDECKQDTSIADLDKSPSKQDDIKHNTPSCSQADYDNLSLRSSPSGASTSSSASYPPVLRVSSQQLESKQSSDSTDSDQKDYPNNNFCFNFEIEPDDIDQGPPAKKKPGKTGNPSTKQAKEDSGSSEGSPKIGELEKKGPKKGGRRRKKKEKTAG
ncbi:uncharacterized protein [Amphiura filiformis]|uniref:uncharacterized protein n=1 Tax=Amphiura filiformis TaxID=82378 RepID=UPI003B20C328